MPYKISEFDGLTIPEFLRRGDTQSIGTGTARPDMLQLPGGRFYDNQGAYDSPRQLDPITKRCVIYAQGANTVHDQVEELREKIGKRGVLKVLWHDNETRWQYARLIRMRTPRPRGTALEWIPVDLQFMPSMSKWYGLTETVDTTTFPGATGTSDTVTVNNAGNARATEVNVEYECPATDASFELVIGQQETGQRLHLGLSTDYLSVTAGDLIVFDTAQKYIYHMEASINVATIGREVGARTAAEEPSVLTATLASAHGYAVDDVIRVADNTEGWDGFYTITAVPTGSTLEAWLDPNKRAVQVPGSTSGNVRKCNSIYQSNYTIIDPAYWFWLEPGDNDIWISAGSDNLDSGVLTVTFYPTYA